FKGYISDLVHSMDCFQRTPDRKECSTGFDGVKTISEIPVLFYISSNNDENYDFVNCLQSSLFMGEHETKELYVIDNMRVTFILSVLSYIESQHSDYEWFFFHPTTGMNISDSNIERHSKIMQIEFLTNSFVPFLLKKKVGDKETCKFFLATTDHFSRDNFAKLVTYCRDNSNDIVQDLEISMPDYFVDDHYEIVKKVLNAKEDYIDVKVSNFNSSFRSLANE
ncbi:MAG: hypothetical protein WA981_14110, partial [Glaciecola sp.]